MTEANDPLSAFDGLGPGGLFDLPSGPVKLDVPLPCWHESSASARTDSMVALSETGGFIATDRALPEGTTVFLELSLGNASNAPKAEIDAVVVWTDVPDLGVVHGFGLRFLNVNDAVKVWINNRTAPRDFSPPEVPADEAPAPQALAAESSPEKEMDDSTFEVAASFEQPETPPAGILALDSAAPPAAPGDSADQTPPLPIAMDALKTPAPSEQTPTALTPSMTLIYGDDDPPTSEPFLDIDDDSGQDDTDGSEDVPPAPEPFLDIDDDRNQDDTDGSEDVPPAPEPFLDVDVDSSQDDADGSVDVPPAPEPFLDVDVDSNQDDADGSGDITPAPEPFVDSDDALPVPESYEVPKLPIVDEDSESFDAFDAWDARNPVNDEANLTPEVPDLGAAAGSVLPNSFSPPPETLPFGAEAASGDLAIASQLGSRLEREGKSAPTSSPAETIPLGLDFVAAPPVEAAPANPLPATESPFANEVAAHEVAAHEVAAHEVTSEPDSAEYSSAEFESVPPKGNIEVGTTPEMLKVATTDSFGAEIDIDELPSVDIDDVQEIEQNDSTAPLAELNVAAAAEAFSNINVSEPPVTDAKAGVANATEADADDLLSIDISDEPQTEAVELNTESFDPFLESTEPNLSVANNNVLDPSLDISIEDAGPAPVSEAVSEALPETLPASNLPTRVSSVQTERTQPATAAPVQPALVTPTQAQPSKPKSAPFNVIDPFAPPPNTAEDALPFSDPGFAPPPSPEIGSQEPAPDVVAGSLLPPALPENGQATSVLVGLVVGEVLDEPLDEGPALHPTTTMQFGAADISAALPPSAGLSQATQKKGTPSSPTSTMQFGAFDISAARPRSPTRPVEVTSPRKASPTATMQFGAVQMPQNASLPEPTPAVAARPHTGRAPARQGGTGTLQLASNDVQQEIKQNIARDLPADEDIAIAVGTPLDDDE